MFTFSVEEIFFIFVSSVESIPWFIRRVVVNIVYEIVENFFFLDSFKFFLTFTIKGWNVFQREICNRVGLKDLFVETLFKLGLFVDKDWFIRVRKSLDVGYSFWVFVGSSYEVIEIFFFLYSCKFGWTFGGKSFEIFVGEFFYLIII